MAGRHDIKTVHGFSMWEVASAFQKMIRRGDEKMALYWGIELDRTGYGEYAWKRMRIMASEDVGLAESGLVADLRALYQNWLDQKKKRDEKHGPERLFLVHAIIMLARARKSRQVDHALIYFYSELATQEMQPTIPDVALDKHTARGKRMKRGWEHFFTEGIKLENEAFNRDPYLEDAKRAAMAPVDHAAKAKRAASQQKNGSVFDDWEYDDGRENGDRVD